MRSFYLGRFGLLIVAALAGGFASCGDDDGDTTPDPDTGPRIDMAAPPPPPPADMGPTERDMAIDMTMMPPPDAGPPGPTVTVSGAVQDFLSGGAVEGMEVCIYELPDFACDTTGIDGMYRLNGVPANANLRLTFVNEAGGWQRAMTHITTREDEDFALTTQSIQVTLAEGLATDAGITFDPTLALVIFNGFDVPNLDRTTRSTGPLAGVTPTLDPDDADALAFITESFTVDATLTATTATGLGFYANVPAGEHTLRLSHPDRDCGPNLGWSGASMGEFRVDVVGGWFVFGAGVRCAPRM